MAIQTINIGTVANDGTGDDLREAFVKVNANFAELSARNPEATTGVNLGASGEGVFAQLNGAEMQFKNNSEEYAELFSVGSEIVESSK